MQREKNEEEIVRSRSTHEVALGAVIGLGKWAMVEHHSISFGGGPLAAIAQQIDVGLGR